MKTAKKIWNIVSICLIALTVILAILVAGVRLFGVKVYTVLSGSMEPHFLTGSIIYVVDTPVEELEVGDVITFEMSGGGEVECTHRIVQIEERDGELFFYTKGDANETTDSPVSESRVIGEAVFSIPLLGYLLNYIQNPPGSYVAIAVAAVLLLLIILPDLIFDDKKKAETQEAEMQEEHVVFQQNYILNVQPTDNTLPEAEETNNEENA